MKTLPLSRKNLKYLSLVGLSLAVVGLVAGVISGTWSFIPLGLIVIGVLLIIASPFLAGNQGKIGFWGRRSTRASTNALVATLAVLIILGLANFLAVRYSTRVDFTENQVLTLAPQSQQVVRSLQQPVKVWVFDRTPSSETRSLLENYRRQGTQFSFSVVDPQREPGLAQKFEVTRFGDIYLESGNRRQLLHAGDLPQPLSESKLTNAIEQITSDRTDRVYFLQGHGELPLESAEAGLSQALNILQQKSFISEPLNLTKEPAIPQDAAVIVVAGPRRALFPQEVKALQTYLNSGGSLLVMVDPTVDPGLNELLQEWGVALDNRLAIDASGKGNLVGLGVETTVITNYGNHPITQAFRNGISFYRLARPLELTPVEGIEQTPLLLTDENSWAESNLESEQLEFNPESDRKGPLTLGAALRRQNVEGENQRQPRLVVFGNSSFASDAFFDQQLNGDVLLNSITWLSERDEQVLSIAPKESQNRRINLNQLQATSISLVALGVVPLVGFISAGFMWWRRR